MERASPITWVVDDDADVRGAVALLLRTADLEVEACASGEELLARLEPGAAGCILLDLRMPGMSGLEVQRELLRRGLTQPVVFLSGHGDIPIAVRAVQAGALDFLEKPFRNEKLLAAVARALTTDRVQREAGTRRAERQALLASLSRREAEVAQAIAEGLTTSDIAASLGLSPRTVEMHRARLRKRLGASSLAEIVRIVTGAEPDGGSSSQRVSERHGS